jgi:DNA-binding LacI/PurR family transcriptional regulator
VPAKPVYKPHARERWNRHAVARECRRFDGGIPTADGKPTRRPTINDVARRASVSKGAVSFALNDRPGVADATRKRILRAARDLGWQPSAGARALSRARAGAFGLILRRDPAQLGADPFFVHFVAGVETVFGASGCALMLQMVGSATAEAAAYQEAAEARRVDGVFLLDLRRRDPRYGLVSSLGLPALAVGTPIGRCPLPSLGSDDGAAIQAAVEHLLELGHRRIGYVGGAPGLVHSIARQAAYRRALDEAGLEPGPEMRGDFTGESGARATRRLLDLPEPPTAVIYANDLMAVAGLGAARERGLQLPRDLSVVGFDDIELAAHLSPPLTTIRQDPVPWGRAAAEVLLAVADGEPSTPGPLEPHRLIVRGSTAAPRPKGRR